MATNLDTYVLEEVFNRACEVYPNDVARISRGLNIVLDNEVTQITRGMWAVKSQTTDNVTYIVENSYCPCPDSVNRPVTCKHVWAVKLMLWTIRRTNKLMGVAA